MSSARTGLRLHAALVLAFVCLLSSPARAQDDAPAAPSHTTAHIAIGAGLGLTVASFFLADAGDKAYERYLTETDPALLEDHYDDARRYDKLAAGTLVVGQLSLVYGLWRRFLHDPPHGAAHQLDHPVRPTWSVAPCLGPDGPALAIDVRI